MVVPCRRSLLDVSDDPADTSWTEALGGACRRPADESGGGSGRWDTQRETRPRPGGGRRWLLRNEPVDGAPALPIRAADPGSMAVIGGLADEPAAHQVMRSFSRSG
jgi:hypothetical protein